MSERVEMFAQQVEEARMELDDAMKSSVNVEHKRDLYHYRLKAWAEARAMAEHPGRHVLTAVMELELLMRDGVLVELLHNGEFTVRAGERVGVGSSLLAAMTRFLEVA